MGWCYKVSAVSLTADISWVLLGAVYHHEVKEKEEDRQAVIKRNRDLLSVICVCHPLALQYSTSCTHLIRLDEMTNLCSTLPEEVILEIKYVLLIMSYSTSHRISHYRPLQLIGSDSVS